MKKSKIREITVISVFTALLVLCSWLSVPNTVPFTMQAFGVFLAATLLGKKKGTIVIVVYLGLGALGIPVFAGGKAGISALLGQTGGYISGFLPCAFVCNVVLHTALGTLIVQGSDLKLKTLSLEGGQVAVDGSISALIYEEPRLSGWRHLFG